MVPDLTATDAREEGFRLVRAVICCGIGFLVVDPTNLEAGAQVDPGNYPDGNAVERPNGRRRFEPPPRRASAAQQRGTARER